MPIRKWKSEPTLSTPPEDNWVARPFGMAGEPGGSGSLPRLLRNMPLTDMEKRDDYSYGNMVAAVPGEFVIVYLGKGGSFSLIAPDVPDNYTAYNPKTGDVIESGIRKAGDRHLNFPFGDPVVVIFVK